MGISFGELYTLETLYSQDHNVIRTCPEVHYSSDILELVLSYVGFGVGSDRTSIPADRIHAVCSFRETYISQK